MTEASPCFDKAYWDGQIQAAIQEPDPTLSNLKITRVHYLLSHALIEVTGGPDGGANFHSWAVWGSRKAGVTIQREDMESALRDAGHVSGIVGAGIGGVVGAEIARRIPFGPWGARLPVGMITGIACGKGSGAAVGRAIATYSRNAASALILAGNRTVLEDIGAQTVRFLECFHDQPTPDTARLAEFLRGLRPGPSSKGGQGLLRQAFTQYHNARFATTPKGRHEAMYFGNCLAVLHEHYRLEPYIRGSMPWIIRRCVTGRMMRFDVGVVSLSVSHDVPAMNGVLFPPTLEKIASPQLETFLHGPNGWDVGADTLSNTGARDWTHLRERMGYIVNLFRALHLDPAVRNAPYTPEQFAAIDAGRIPDGPL